VAGGKRTAADLGAWLIFEDESGQGFRPSLLGGFLASIRLGLACS